MTTRLFGRVEIVDILLRADENWKRRRIERTVLCGAEGEIGDMWSPVLGTLDMITPGEGDDI